MANSFEVIKPFAEALEKGSNFRQNFQPTVQIIGGVNSAALTHSDTVIDFENKEVIAPDSLDLPTLRPNGSLRDLDVLVLSSSLDDIQSVENLIRETVRGELDPSVFSLKNEESLKKQILKPLFGFAAIRTCLSDRYVVSENTERSLLPYTSPIHSLRTGRGYGMVKSLFPLATPIEQESLETWTLSVGDAHIPVPNPAMTIINYTNRSIRGIRSKDKAKVEKMASMVFSKAPKLREWAIYGPGSDQVYLGELLKSLTPNKDHGDIFGVGNMGSRMSRSNLAEHESFMAKDLSHEEKCQILAVAAIKASLLSFAESNKFISTFFQRFVERRIDSIVKNS